VTHFIGSEDFFAGTQPPMRINPCENSASATTEKTQLFSFTVLSLQQPVTSELHAAALKIDLFLHQQGIDTTDASRQSHVPDDGRLRRVRAVDGPRTSPRWAGAGP
jgi:hypothetical protein